MYWDESNDSAVFLFTNGLRKRETFAIGNLSVFLTVYSWWPLVWLDGYLSLSHCFIFSEFISSSGVIVIRFCFLVYCYTWFLSQHNFDNNCKKLFICFEMYTSGFARLPNKEDEIIFALLIIRHFCIKMVT